MKLPRSLAFLAFAPILTGSAHGAASTAKSELGVAVLEISETRGTGAQISECRLYLNLTGDAVAEAHSVHRIRVKRAEDELGRDLVKAETASDTTGAHLRPPSPADEQRRLEAVAAEVARRRALREGAASKAPAGSIPNSSFRAPRPVIALRNPSRQSSSIKIIEGEIDMFVPTEANGGVMRIARIAEHAGEIVNNDAAGIQVACFTEQAFETKGQLLGSDARDAFTGAFKVHGRDAVLISLHDPKQRVVDFGVQTVDGKRIPTEAFFGGGATWNRSVLVKTPLPADAQLVLSIAQPTAIKTYPFKLENIPLP